MFDCIVLHAGARCAHSRRRFRFLQSPHTHCISDAKLQQRVVGKYVEMMMHSQCITYRKHAVKRLGGRHISQQWLKGNLTNTRLRILISCDNDNISYSNGQISRQRGHGECWNYRSYRVGHWGRISSCWTTRDFWQQTHWLQVSEMTMLQMN